MLVPIAPCVSLSKTDALGALIPPETPAPTLVDFFNTGEVNVPLLIWLIIIMDYLSLD